VAIDLRSDTVTRPTAAMRKAMADAEVGDDVLDGDPTTKKLEARVAEMLGKEGALFFPSGSMANQSAVWLLSRPGSEILIDAGAHIVHYEYAGAAALSGAQLRMVTPAGAVMTAAELEATFRIPSPHVPGPSLVCAENTHNGAGGMITPLPALRAIATVARERGVNMHLDGARLWNASAASDTSLKDFASCADTVMVSFSKGLGCPVGAALAGPKAVIAEGWTVRKRFGGGMRQSGVLTAAALYALDNHLARLGEDHARAKAYAKRIDGAGGAKVVPPDTNIVMLDLPVHMDAFEIVAAAAKQDVKLVPWSRSRIRSVFHLDIDDRGTATAGDIVAGILEKAGKGN
jgi:threonine aldolase